jgi:Ca2+-binding EF-hand superfamily protein
MKLAPKNNSKRTEEDEKPKPIRVSFKAVKSAAKERGEEEWFTLFRLLDTNNDGLVELELLQVAVMNSAKNLGLGKDEAIELLADVASNDDKYVDFGEFSAMVSFHTLL